MNKEQALAKIEELKKFVEDLDNKQDRITQWPTEEDEELKICEAWAADICTISSYNGKLGHPWDRCGIYLSDCEGKWVDEEGQAIQVGHIFFIPNSQP